MKLLWIIAWGWLVWLPMSCEAGLRGRLDLGLDVNAVGFRELDDGQWLTGVSKRLWYLENGAGNEVLHFSPLVLWNAERGNQVLGLGAGFGIGAVGDRLQQVVEQFDLSLPPWGKQLGNWISLDAFVGYRPYHTEDVHDLTYGIGGKVRIPMDLLKGL